MTWVLAQAGNRASKTRPYLQWWVNESEQDVRSSALQNLHYSASLIDLLLITCWAVGPSRAVFQPDLLLIGVSCVITRRCFEGGPPATASIVFLNSRATYFRSPAVAQMQEDPRIQGGRAGGPAAPSNSRCVV